MRKFRTGEKVWFISNQRNLLLSNLHNGTIVWKPPLVRYDDLKTYYCEDPEIPKIRYEVETKFIFKKKDEAIKTFKKLLLEELKQNQERQKALEKALYSFEQKYEQ